MRGEYKPQTLTKNLSPIDNSKEKVSFLQCHLNEYTTPAVGDQDKINSKILLKVFFSHIHLSGISFNPYWSFASMSRLCFYRFCLCVSLHVFDCLFVCLLACFLKRRERRCSVERVWRWAEVEYLDQNMLYKTIFNYKIKVTNSAPFSVFLFYQNPQMWVLEMLPMWH